jgi:hypothetical protein
MRLFYEHWAFLDAKSSVTTDNFNSSVITDDISASTLADTPIRINSGYRSPQLNKKVGGVPTSNHLTGCAVDIRVADMGQLIRYAAILMDYSKESHQDFDEILIEKNRYGAIWLHFAVRPKDNRRKILFLSV